MQSGEQKLKSKFGGPALNSFDDVSGEEEEQKSDEMNDKALIMYEVVEDKHDDRDINNAIE